MSGLKEKIEASVTIEDVCRHIGVNLKYAGGELKGLCPLHEEDTPSFHVNPKKGLFYCFGCGEGGDLFSLVQKTQHVPFAESMALLADWFGIEYDERELPTKKSLLSEAMDIFGQNVEPALEYLGARGISRDTAAAFGVGFAEGGYSRELTRLGFTAEELKAANLIGETGHELFAGRVIIPLRSTSGLLVGISGRSVNKDTHPKYMTTSSTPLFDKRVFIFGASNLRGKNEAVIVEGQLDAMSLYQSGVANAVAVLGSNITDRHVISLKRIGIESVVAVGDADEAGQKLTRRILKIARAHLLKGYAVIMPAGSDANDVLAREGEESLVALINKKMTEAEWLLSVCGTPDDGFAPCVAQYIAGLSRYDPLRKRVVDIAEVRYGVSRRELQRYLSSIVNTPPRQESKRSPIPSDLKRAIARALIDCPSESAVELLKRVYDAGVVDAIAKTIPIKEVGNGDCDSVKTLINEATRRRLEEELAKSAAGGAPLSKLLALRAQLDLLNKQTL